MLGLDLLLIVAVLLLIPTAYAGKIGAPYAPTPLPVVKKAFHMLEVGPADTVIDIGAGDGKILLLVEQRGAQAIGVELSPILWFIARLRTLSHRKITLLYGNFYKRPLPEETTIIFAFLMPANMPRVRQYIERQNLPNGKYFLAYAFPFKDVEPLTIVREKKCGPLYVYDLQKLKAKNEERKTTM